MSKRLSQPQSLEQYHDDLEAFDDWVHNRCTVEYFDDVFNNPTTKQKRLLRGLSEYDIAALIYRTVPVIALPEEDFDPTHEDKEAKRISESINLGKLQYNKFDGFIDYNDFPEVYTKVILDGETLDDYVIQRCYPYSVYCTKTRKYVKIGYGKNNYPTISFTVNGKSKRKRIHVLVGRMFIPNPENKPFVDHRFSNHNDWRLVLAMRYATRSQNGKNKHGRDDLKQFTELPEHYRPVPQVISITGHVHPFKPNELFVSKVDGLLVRNMRMQGKLYREIDCERDNGNTQVNDANGIRTWITLSRLIEQVFGNI